MKKIFVNCVLIIALNLVSSRSLCADFYFLNPKIWYRAIPCVILKDGESCLKLAEYFLLERGDLDAAKLAYKKATETEVAAEAYFKLGDLAEEGSAEALEYYKQAAKTYINFEEKEKKCNENLDGKSCFRLAASLEKLEETDKAAEYYKKAADLGHFTAFFNLAKLARKQGNPDNSQKYYEKGIEEMGNFVKQIVEEKYKEEEKKEEDANKNKESL